MIISYYKELKHYLTLNNADEIYNGIKRAEEGYTEDFKKRIIKLLDKDNRAIRRLIHSYKEHYKEGITFAEYYNNIMECIGKGDADKGLNIVMEEFTKIAEKIATKEKEIKAEDVLKYLYIIHFYKPYVGFLSETVIAATLEHSGLFTVCKDNTLDNIYKIDLLISCNVEGLEGYKIGLQCKANTFKDINHAFMESYKEGNKKAITEGITDDVYYILSQNLNIIGTVVTNGLERWQSINFLSDKPFNFGSGYIPIPEEGFIKELVYKFYKLKEEDRLKDNPFKEIFKLNIRKHYEEWYKLNICGKIKKMLI